MDPSWVDVGVSGLISGGCGAALGAYLSPQNVSEKTILYAMLAFMIGQGVMLSSALCMPSKTAASGGSAQAGSSSQPTSPTAQDTMVQRSYLHQGSQRMQPYYNNCRTMIGHSKRWGVTYDLVSGLLALIVILHFVRGAPPETILYSSVGAGVFSYAAQVFAYKKSA